MRLRLRLTRRKILWILAIWVFVVLFSLGLAAYQMRLGNLRALSDVFNRWSGPGKGETIVLFAPHCDDETLAAAGLMREAKLRGADVWVVLMTNGDGFRYAAALDSRSLIVRPKYFVEFGYQRQRESIAALKTLGIPRDHIITLGYPDRGLHQMWVSNWNTPFRSAYTNDNHSPYDDSFTRNAPYEGRQLMSDLKDVLKKIKPDQIYMPHPNDQHPDHWATSAFVTSALYDLRWLDNKTIGLYLVHRGDWPVPQGLHPTVTLAPPAKLLNLDTYWYQYPISKESEAKKREAVAQYRSQFGPTMRFLRSFIRENELFGERDAMKDIESAPGIKVDGKTADWEGIDPIILDPIDDGLVAHSFAGSDITRIYLVENDGRLYLRVSVRGKIGRNSAFEVHMRELHSSSDTTNFTLQPNLSVPSNCKVAFGRNDVELSCPADGWKNKPFIISVDSRDRGIYVDRSAYSIIKW